MSGVTSKNYFATLNVIYYGVMVTMVFFSGIVIFMGVQRENIELEELFTLIVPVVVIACYTAAYFVFKSSVQRISKNDQLRTKMTRYQGAILVRAGLVEAPGIFGAVASWITGNNYFLLATLLSIIVFLLQRPSVYSAVEDLSLSPDEKSKLENPDEIIAERQTTSV